MFTWTDTPVKFVGLIVLFAFATLWSLYQLARRQSGPTVVSNLAHLAMAVVMLLMVPGALWQPFSAVVPLPALVGFFGMFALWFGFLGVRGLVAGGHLRRHGWHAAGHAGMFGAMTWHLAAMLGHHPDGHEGDHHEPTGTSVDHGHAAHAGTGHVGAPHAEEHMLMEPTSAAAHDPALLIAVIGVPFMIYLLLAAVWSLKNAIAPSPDILDRAGHETAGHGHAVAGNPRVAALAEFAMSFGMFWMSTGLLAALVPVFGTF